MRDELIAQAKLLSYFVPKLETLLNAQSTKRLLLLAIYDYLIGEISFSTREKDTFIILG